MGEQEFMLPKDEILSDITKEKLTYYKHFLSNKNVLLTFLLTPMHFMWWKLHEFFTKPPFHISPMAWVALQKFGIPPKENRYCLKQSHVLNI